MHSPNRIEQHLRVNLLAILGETPSSVQVDEFALFCHRLALISLRHKRERRTYREDILGLTVEDAAYDCIAELFRRDDAGSFVQLKAYFGGIDLANLPQEHLVAHLRRLVFAKVNEGMARMYHEADPILSRILRNLKLAVASLGNFEEIERFGESYLAPSFVEPLDHLPLLTLEELENMLTGAVHQGSNAPTVLNALAIALTEQSDSARVVPLLLLGHAVRSLFSMEERSVLTTIPDNHAMLEDDVRRAIDEGLSLIKGSLFAEYVQARKLSHEMFETYFVVIQKYLHAKLVLHDGRKSSLFNLAKEEFPGLTNKDYREQHRPKLEYFLKLTQEKTIALLTK